ncbi:NADP-dependent 3-hydroxy acid dehydrogenase YdfG [Blastococcus aggregatus]|uniref:NADP-dependent 3-hydroxy acid dehydrogenase YdfG n=1 Tax=Blastococcus aggregatus TaxID=38502 RepID=A0A285V4P2_9ACTN|nr:SDR family oxidoreductase [Blastococcus aggregatus]SOC48568.1 NADP-dependent 3-hydroxy acid dehydrogenase YdfG [Blastococcus aggregatus]
MTFLSPSSFSGQVALVTGAGQGVGEAIATRLAAAGADLALVDLRADTVRAVADRIVSETGRVVRHYAADVRDREALASVVEDAEGLAGRLDVLVNNAGMWISGRFLESSPEDWQTQLDVNLGGVLHLSHLVVPGMTRHGYGRVVNVISDSARVGEPGVSVYAAAKAAVAGFSRVLAKEVGKHGVTVNCVSLSTTVTPGAHDTFTEEQLDRMPKFYPVRRLGRPEDAAAAVTYFAGRDAEWVTGQTLSVNGGYATL